MNLIKMIKVRPTCITCGQFIYDDECYEVSNYELMCNECVKTNIEDMKSNCDFSFAETVEEMFSELKVDTDNYVKDEEVIA